jgi:hypothetical protein
VCFFAWYNDKTWKCSPHTKDARFSDELMLSNSMFVWNRQNLFSIDKSDTVIETPKILPSIVDGGVGAEEIASVE